MKIVSKMDQRTKLMDAQQTSEVHELTDAELDTVSGGMLSFGDGRAATAPQSTAALTQMMQQLIQQLSGQGR